MGTNRTEWKKNRKRVGKLKRKRIKVHNVSFPKTPKAYSVKNPKTRRKDRET